MKFCVMALLYNSGHHVTQILMKLIGEVPFVVNQTILQCSS